MYTIASDSLTVNTFILINLLKENSFDIIDNLTKDVPNNLVTSRALILVDKKTQYSSIIPYKDVFDLLVANSKIFNHHLKLEDRVKEKLNHVNPLVVKATQDDIAIAKTFMEKLIYLKAIRIACLEHERFIKIVELYKKETLL